MNVYKPDFWVIAIKENLWPKSYQTQAGEVYRLFLVDLAEKTTHIFANHIYGVSTLRPSDDDVALKVEMGEDYEYEGRYIKPQIARENLLYKVETNLTFDDNALYALYTTRLIEAFREANTFEILGTDADGKPQWAPVYNGSPKLTKA